MGKKILILGGAGYIGGYTTDYLVDKGMMYVCSINWSMKGDILKMSISCMVT